MSEKVERRLVADRLYSLGDFKNIRFIDEITNLPEEVIVNNTLLDQFRFLQLLAVETAFQRYIILVANMKDMSPEEKVEFMEKSRLDTIESIKEAMSQ